MRLGVKLRVLLKGVCNELFALYFFMIRAIWAPEKLLKIVLVSISPRYFTAKIEKFYSAPPRCHSHHWVTKKLEYLSEIETEFENILTWLSGTKWVWITKKQRVEISWHTPFKQLQRGRIYKRRRAKHSPFFRLSSANMQNSLALALRASVLYYIYRPFCCTNARHSLVHI